MAKYSEVPSWATAMVDNFRRAASVPPEITNLEIFQVVEDQDLCLLDSEEDKMDILRSELGLD